jgi:hypothetical protein
VPRMPHAFFLALSFFFWGDLFLSFRRSFFRVLLKTPHARRRSESQEVLSLLQED